MENAEIARLSGTWGLLYMMTIFAVACGYALWPRNRAKFERAARLPLNDDLPLQVRKEQP